MEFFKGGTFKKQTGTAPIPLGDENEQFEKLRRDNLQLRENVIHDAKKGNPKALNSIGSAYYSKGGKSNYAKALVWYQRAAEKGNPQAQNMIGTMYQQGKGTRKSDVSAIEYYLKSAKQGYPKAMSNLAMMYRHGFGTGVNHLKAIMWYSKAANSGESLAQYNIETMYKEHPLSNDEYKKLVKIHMDDAENGNPYAEYNLGIMYRDGRGVNVDKAVSMEWFVKSAAQGHPMALTELPKDKQKEIEELTKQRETGRYDEETSPTVTSGGSPNTPPEPITPSKPTPPPEQVIRDQDTMLRNFQYQLERDKWEKEQMMQKINELTNLVEAMARTSLGSSNNSDPASPRGSVYVPMDRRRISEYVGDQLDQMHGIIHKEDDETQLQRLIRERERRDLEIQQIQREYESRIQMLREEQARGQYRRPLTQMQPPQERQTLNRLQSGEGAYQPQQDTLLLERQFPNDDPAHYDMYYDSESEKDINCEDGRSSRGRSNSYRNGHIRGSNSNNNLINDNISMYSAGQLNSNNSNNSNMSYTNDQASIYSNGYSNTNNINYINDRASAYSDGIQNNFDNTNDRASTSSYGIQSNYINNNNERGNNASNGHPSPYSINSDPNSSYSSTIGPTTIYGSNSVPMYNGSPPFFGNTTHLGPYSTSPVNGYIHSANSNYGSGSGGLNSGYTSSSHRSNYEDEDQARFERRQSELEASYSEVMEMAQKK